MTSGFKYFSTAGMETMTDTNRRAVGRLPFFELWDLRFGDFFQQPQDDGFTRHTFRLGLEVRAEAVTQHGNRNFLYVVQRHAETSFHRRQGLAPLNQKLTGARAGAPIDKLLHK